MGAIFEKIKQKQVKEAYLHNPKDRENSKAKALVFSPSLHFFFLLESATRPVCKTLNKVGRKFSGSKRFTADFP